LAWTFVAPSTAFDSIESRMLGSSQSIKRAAAICELDKLDRGAKYLNASSGAGHGGVAALRVSPACWCLDRTGS
jgi:hypothetical protein